MAMENFHLLIIYYFVAYLIVTVIGVLHTIFNIYVLHYKSMKNSPGMGEAYEKTKPFHPLYNLLVFPLFAWFYLFSIDNISLGIALLAGLIWASLTIVIDLFGWVLIKHPWSLSLREFYIDYQPWITITYLVILLSPALAYLVMSLV